MLNDRLSSARNSVTRSNVLFLSEEWKIWSSLWVHRCGLRSETLDEASSRLQRRKQQRGEGGIPRYSSTLAVTLVRLGGGGGVSTDLAVLLVEAVLAELAAALGAEEAVRVPRLSQRRHAFLQAQNAC